MITIKIENVSEQRHRSVLSEILSGDFSYTPGGEQVDQNTFEFSLNVGEYAVIMDEMLT